MLIQIFILSCYIKIGEKFGNNLSMTNNSKTLYLILLYEMFIFELLYNLCCYDAIPTLQTMNFMISATKKEATGASYNQWSVEYTAESDTDTSAEIEKDSLEDFSSSSTFPVESVRYV